MENKRPRGPVAKSCITCKRRHKKCDQDRPNCNRCTKGGYDCSYEQGERPSPYGTKSPKRCSTTPISPSNDPSSQPCNRCDLSPALSNTVTDNSQSSQRECSGSEDLPTLDQSHTHEIPSGSKKSLQTQISQSPLVLQANPGASSAYLEANLMSTIRIPPSVVLLSPDSWRSINYIMAQYDQIAQLAYFKPMQYRMREYRSTLLLRLQSSSITRRTKMISFKVCEAVLAGDIERYQRIFEGWIQLLEAELCTSHKHNPTLEAAEYHLGEALELSHVKSMLLINRNAYHYLRYMAPLFLHTVLSDASLWPDGYGFSTIPITRILSSPRCELGHFVFMDTIYSMSLGLPHLVSYDTSVPFEMVEVGSYATSHGCPAELHLALVDINLCRDRSPLARNWREIEQTLLKWEPRPIRRTDEWDSWMTIAWFAVQESWRHALLAYLYMAAAGVASDDSRVQSSVQQIFRVVKTLRETERPAIKLQIFVQYLIAGICAWTNKQRRIVRDQFVNTPETRAWMIGCSSFVPVLDHLWGGAAFGGTPIRWSDYMNSREVTLPVSQ